MTGQWKRHVVAALVLAAIAGASALAHEMTIKGTVAGLESSRIQVKTGEEKQGQSPAWYPIDAKTKIMRDKTVVTLAQARIAVGERVVLNVDHESDTRVRTLEIRLAAAAAVDIALTTRPSPPKVGANDFDVTLTDASGPVSGAEVTVTLVMPAMPSMKMPEMRKEIPLKAAGPGKYTGRGDVPMAGQWDVTVLAKKGGKEIGRKSTRLTAK